MQTFTELEPNMLSLTGAFYPTGYVFAMFSDIAEARRVAHEIETHAMSARPVLLLDATTVLSRIAHTVGSADIPLPSAGTESATVRHYAALAAQGHCALMIHAPSASKTEAVMTIVRTASPSFAEKYRHLVIEDLT